MPRQAAAAAGFATGTSGTQMLINPPEDLDQIERVEFANLIAGAPPSHFVPSDIPLLACYSKAIVAERTAGELAAAPVVSSPNGNRPSPWLAIWMARKRAVTTLARMLSLSPGGRVASKPSEADGPVSYYSRVALEAKRDVANN